MSERSFTPGPWPTPERALSGNWLLGRPAVAGASKEGDANLIGAAPELYEALETFVTEYVELVNSGDAGSWDPEVEPKVIAARAALAKARGEFQ